MSADSIIVDLDVFEDDLFHMFACCEVLAMDRLDFERMKETLGASIIIAVTLTAH